MQRRAFLFGFAATIGGVALSQKSSAQQMAQGLPTQPPVPEKSEALVEALVQRKEILENFPVIKKFVEEACDRGGVNFPDQFMEQNRAHWEDKINDPRWHRDGKVTLTLAMPTPMPEDKYMFSYTTASYTVDLDINSGTVSEIRVHESKDTYLKEQFREKKKPVGVSTLKP